MIFIDANYQEAAQYFALEEFLCTQKQFDDGVFMLWQTRPTVLEVGIGHLERILLLRWLRRKNFQQVSWKFH